MMTGQKHMLPEVTAAQAFLALPLLETGLELEFSKPFKVTPQTHFSQVADFTCLQTVNSQGRFSDFFCPHSPFQGLNFLPAQLRMRISRANILPQILGSCPRHGQGTRDTFLEFFLCITLHYFIPWPFWVCSWSPMLWLSSLWVSSWAT